MREEIAFDLRGIDRTRNRPQVDPVTGATQLKPEIAVVLNPPTPPQRPESMLIGEPFRVAGNRDVTEITLSHVKLTVTGEGLVVPQEDQSRLSTKVQYDDVVVPGRAEIFLDAAEPPKPSLKQRIVRKLRKRNK